MFCIFFAHSSVDYSQAKCGYFWFKLAKEQKKNEKQEKKQEISKLLEYEEASIGGKSSASVASAPRMTRHEIMVAQQQESAKDGNSTQGYKGEDEDDDRDLMRNMNREIGINDSGARNVDEALAQLA